MLLWCIILVKKLIVREYCHLIAFYFYNQLNKMQENLDTQQKQIAAIERTVDPQSPEKFSLKKFCKDNAKPIIVTTSMVLVPVEKYMYKHWATNRALQKVTEEYDSKENKWTVTDVEPKIY